MSAIPHLVIEREPAPPDYWHHALRIVGRLFWAGLIVTALVGGLVLVAEQGRPQTATEPQQGANHIAGAYTTLQSHTEPPAWVLLDPERYPCEDGEVRRYEPFGVGLWRSWCEVNHE